MKKYNDSKDIDETWERGRGGGRGGHHGRRKRRGRPQKLPNVDSDWNPSKSHVILELYDYELEVLRLIDIEGLTQEEVSQKLKPEDDSISRGNINRYLQRSRKRIVNALLTAENITIKIIKTQ